MESPIQRLQQRRAVQQKHQQTDQKCTSVPATLVVSWALSGCDDAAATREVETATAATATAVVVAVEAIVVVTVVAGQIPVKFRDPPQAAATDPRASRGCKQ
mmetsp:Transcript_129951/g.296296  ORF Transcript_129951/g.296296 Transcript_129951/m.296296 type:complete len:102 (+) Transcript_129951:67-372(+)